MFGWLGLGKIVGEVAKEWIDTPEEKAQAFNLKLKTLDPNGIMRRELARFASIAYAYYLTITSILALMMAFGVGDGDGAKIAMEAMTDLFLPITGSWTAIVTASFGVNVSNNWKDAKTMGK